MATHVTNQDLAGYLHQPTSENFAFVKRHIAKCESCRTSYEQMQAIARQLKNGPTADLTSINEPHLTDEQIIAYVHRQAVHGSMDEIQSHLDHCGSCMKAVLRYRAHQAEYKSQKTQANTQDNIIKLVQRPRSNRQLTRYALPFAAAAGVAIAVLALLQWQIIKTPGQVPGTGQIAQPDLIQPESSSTTTGTPGVMPVSSAGNQPVNWYGGYIETTAIGTADMQKMKNSVQAEIVAEKTARHIAYSQLAEILKGVQVTANSTYEDLLLKVDTLNVQSEGFIQGAQVVNKTIAWVNGAPKATVTVRAPLFGQNSLKNIIQAEAADVLLKQPAQVIADVGPATSGATQYSNVIIDASGLAFTPALFTRLETDNQQVLLPEENAIDLNYMYYADLENARASRYAGGSPMIIKAQAGSRPGTLVLDKADAQLTRAILQNPSADNHKPMLVVF